MNDRTARQDPGSDTISGTVRKVIFSNPRNGYCVFQVDARGHREPAVVVGTASEIEEGMSATATGAWSVHPKFGRQFKAGFVKLEPPGNLAGLKAYLGSKAVEGIGKVHAERMIAKFGEKLAEIIEHHPHRLREIEGIGEVRAAQIARAWERHRETRDVMVHLHGLGLGPAMAATLFRVYGNRAIEVVSTNPFSLIRDIRGVGFRTADRLARQSGIARDHPARIAAGIHHLMNESVSAGNTGTDIEQLQDEAVELLEVARDTVSASLEDEIGRGNVRIGSIGGRGCVFQNELYAAERDICDRIRAIAGSDVPWPAVDSAMAIRQAELADNIDFGRSQKHAIELAIASKFTVITGGPGVGKTTIVNAILKILSERRVEIRICAPTGRAARRASELTGRQALTIHRLLEIDPETGEFRYNSDRQLSCDLVIVDESSMIDVLLMRALMRAVPDRAAVVMVGDIDQLPSVGPGRVLGDVIDSGTVDVVRLTEIYRQAAESRVVANAHRINSGRMPDLSRPDGISDFYFVPANDPEGAMSQVVKIVNERIPLRFGLDPVQDVQVLCPMNRSQIGVETLNARLKDVLNPESGESLSVGSSSYSVGDKVMQLHNDYSKGIFNGDFGIIRGVDADQSSLRVEFDGRALLLGPDDITSITLAYAVTIHKSQGSEFPAVVVPVMTQNYIMLQRNLLYTAVTRARKLVVLIGQEKAVGIAVRTDFQHRRLTRLDELLSTSA